MIHQIVQTGLTGVLKDVVDPPSWVKGTVLFLGFVGLLLLVWLP